jgi:subtilisin family serine protease
MKTPPTGGIATLPPCLLLCAAILLAPAPADARREVEPVGTATAVAAPTPGTTLPWREGEALVRFAPAPGGVTARRTAAGMGLATLRDYPLLSARRGRDYLLVKSPRLTTPELLQFLKKDPRVEKATPNFVIARAATFPDDPLFDRQWGLHNTGQAILDREGVADADIDAPEAWDLSTGSGDPVVAVLDSGVDYTHVELAPNMWTNPREIPGNGLDDDGNGWVDDVHGADLVQNDGQPLDDDGHGTHVAGIVAAAGNNGIGVTGVCWQARIMAVKMLDYLGYGSMDRAIAALEYIVAQKVHGGANVVAINASWGITVNDAIWGGFVPEDGDILYDAIDEAGKADIIFVAAAGNTGYDNDNVVEGRRIYPASYSLPNLIAVAASDWRDEKAYFSTYGRTSIDLFAPGEHVLSTFPGGGYEPGAKGTDLFHDHLEAGDAAWTHHGLQDTWRVAAAPGRPGQAWVAAVAESAQPTDAVLQVTREIDLSGHPEETISLAFRVAANLSGGGQPEPLLTVRCSGDGGVSWYRLDQLTGTFDWQLRSYNVPQPYLNNRFMIRFLLSAGGDGAPGQWVALDDIGVGYAPSAAHVYGSGTSMAAPHVTGAAALVAARHPDETMAARLNRILTTVDHPPALDGLVSTSGRLNLARAVGPEIPPLVQAVVPGVGVREGDTVTVRGVNFGPDQGAVLLARRPGADLRTDRFRFRFLLDSKPYYSTYDGVHLDDVRLASPDTVYFADDMESGGALWETGGRPSGWSLSGESVHDGQWAWSDSPGGSYDDGARSWLRIAAPLDLVSSAGQPVTLSFWAEVEILTGATFSVWFSPDDGLSWTRMGEIGYRSGWNRYEFQVPDLSAAVAAPVQAWSDTAVTFTVPDGAGHYLSVVNSLGLVSTNQGALSAWDPRAPSPYPGIGLRGVPFRGRLYLFGTWDHTDPVGHLQVAVYDPEADAWSDRPGSFLQGERYGHAAAACGNRIHLVSAGMATRTRLDIYDPDSESWTPGPSLSVGLVNPAAVCLDGSLYVLGGYDNNTHWSASRYLFRYDPAARQWARLADMRSRRSYHAAVAARGRIWVFGGADERDAELATAEVYDPRRDEWTPLPDLPGGGVSGLGAATDGRRIYLSGGTGSGQEDPRSDVAVYDLEAGAWTNGGGSLLDLGQPRTGAPLAFLPGHGLVTVGGTLLYWQQLDSTEHLDVQRLYPRLTVLYPDGGERLPSGAAVEIAWGAPPEARRFTVEFSPDGGGSWEVLAEEIEATAFTWIVPADRGNLRAGRIRVTAYDAPGDPLDTDASDGDFHLEVVRLLWPTQGAFVYPGEVRTIRWRTYRTARRVARTALSYRCNYDEKWTRIALLAGNPGSRRWKVPDPGEQIGNCYLQVVLRDREGKTLAQDVNEYPFFIWLEPQ